MLVINIISICFINPLKKKNPHTTLHFEQDFMFLTWDAFFLIHLLVYSNGFLKVVISVLKTLS